MRRKALHVTLNVLEPSTVDLTVGEKVQLDRLVPSRAGHVAERRGGLLKPGSTTMALEPGLYFFKTLSDAHLKVVCGGVATRLGSDKEGWPDPPVGTAITKGDDPPGDRPVLTLE
jgi:hypothetical protein